MGLPFELRWIFRRGLHPTALLDLPTGRLAALAAHSLVELRAVAAKGDIAALPSDRLVEARTLVGLGGRSALEPCFPHGHTPVALPHVSHTPC